MEPKLSNKAIWTGRVRLEHPLFSHVLFPIYVAALLWGGLWLRDRRLRTLVTL